MKEDDPLWQPHMAATGKRKRKIPGRSRPTKCNNRLHRPGSPMGNCRLVQDASVDQHEPKRPVFLEQSCLTAQATVFAPVLGSGGPLLEGLDVLLVPHTYDQLLSVLVFSRTRRLEESRRGMHLSLKSTGSRPSPTDGCGNT